MKQVITLTESDIHRMVMEVILEAESGEDTPSIEGAISKATGASSGLVKKGIKHIEKSNNSTSFKKTKQNYKNRKAHGESTGKAMMHSAADNVKQHVKNATGFWKDLSPEEKAEVVRIAATL